MQNEREGRLGKGQSQRGTVPKCTGEPRTDRALANLARLLAEIASRDHVVEPVGECVLGREGEERNRQVSGPGGTEVNRNKRGER